MKILQKVITVLVLVLAGLSNAKAQGVPAPIDTDTGVITTGAGTYFTFEENAIVVNLSLVSNRKTPTSFTYGVEVNSQKISAEHLSFSGSCTGLQVPASGACYMSVRLAKPELQDGSEYHVNVPIRLNMPDQTKAITSIGLEGKVFKKSEYAPQPPVSYSEYILKALPEICAINPGRKFVLNGVGSINNPIWAVLLQQGFVTEKEIKSPNGQVMLKLSAKALKAFQKKQGIKPALGIFGPKTLEQMKKIAHCDAKKDITAGVEVKQAYWNNWQRFQVAFSEADTAYAKVAQTYSTAISLLNKEDSLITEDDKKVFTTFVQDVTRAKEKYVQALIYLNTNPLPENARAHGYALEASQSYVAELTYAARALITRDEEDLNTSKDFAIRGLKAEELMRQYIGKY